MGGAPPVRVPVRFLSVLERADRRAKLGPVFAVMTFIAAIVEMSVALYRHEKIAASSLGRWDLAAAFIGLDCVVRAFA